MRSEEGGTEGVTLAASPGVRARDPLELTRDMAGAPFFEGVEGGSLAGCIISDVRGLLVASESDEASITPTGRLSDAATPPKPVGRSCRSPFLDMVVSGFINAMNLCLSPFGIMSVTILRPRGSGVSSATVSARGLLVLSERSAAGRASTVLGDPFFLSSSSASISGGKVGDRRGGNLVGDFGRLDKDCVSVALGLAPFTPSAFASRDFFSPLLADASLFPSISIRRGDNRGGIECFEDTSTLMEPPRLPSCVLGRVPLVSRDRGGGDKGRVVEVVADFKMFRPLGRREALVDFPSFEGRLSRDDATSGTFRLGGSSRVAAALSSPTREPSNGFVRLGGRLASSVSLARFLLSGEGGLGGNDAGFGGRLEQVSVRKGTTCGGGGLFVSHTLSQHQARSMQTCFWRNFETRHRLACFRGASNLPVVWVLMVERDGLWASSDSGMAKPREAMLTWWRPSSSCCNRLGTASWRRP